MNRPLLEEFIVFPGPKSATFFAVGCLSQHPVVSEHFFTSSKHVNFILTLNKYPHLCEFDQIFSYAMKKHIKAVTIVIKSETAKVVFITVPSCPRASIVAAAFCSLAGEITLANRHRLLWRQ